MISVFNQIIFKPKTVSINNNNNITRNNARKILVLDIDYGEYLLYTTQQNVTIDFMSHNM